MSTSKEMTESLTNIYYVTPKILPLGEGRVAMTYEAFGVTLSDTTEGLFHNATSRVLGGMTFEKNIYNDERGWGVWNLRNGDKVSFTFTFAGEANPSGVGSAKGTVTITGGDGKASGIRGSFDLTRTMVHSALVGIGQGYTKATIKYTLP